MDSLFWHNLGRLLHILGLAILAGGVFGRWFTDRTIWANYKSAPNQAMAAGRLGAKFIKLNQFGPATLLISGILLLVSNNWTYLGEIWLIIKLALFVLMFLNGILVARPAGKQLMVQLGNWLIVNGATPSKLAALSGAGYWANENLNRAEVEVELQKIHRRFEYFHYSENLLLVVVLVLATFKFN